MTRKHQILVYGLLIILFGLWFWVYQKVSNLQQQPSLPALMENNDLMDPRMLPPKVHLFEIPEKADFAGEDVPLKQPDVRERLEREIYVNAYWHSSTILLKKRAGKMLPIIEKILREQGVPDDFKYLAMAESGLMNVVSPAGARGIWQFMQGTAKDFKLEVSSQVDERYHLEKSTLAACKYLKSAYARFGNWTMVAASYNMGVSGIQKRQQEQGQRSYYDLYLVEETSRYLFRILALKEIFSHPEKYGFFFGEEDFYSMPLFREVMVRESIPNLAEWAIKHNSNYKSVKNHNPWLRANRLDIKGDKSYLIKIPLD